MVGINLRRIEIIIGMKVIRGALSVKSLLFGMDYSVHVADCVYLVDLLKGRRMLNVLVMMSSDINKRMPKIPGFKWGALFNWKLEDAEINEVVRSPPFPEDGRLHTVNRVTDEDIIVDGRRIKRSDDSKLT